MFQIICIFVNNKVSIQRGVIMSKINYLGQSYDLSHGESLLDFLKQNAKKDSKDAVAAKFNGTQVDLTYTAI